jgi:penicillin amidase
MLLRGGSLDVSFFVRQDPRWREVAGPSPGGAIWRALCRQAVAGAIVLGLWMTGYVLLIAIAYRTAAVDSGRIAGLPVTTAVTIARDHRGVPHIAAASLHDLYVAQGFAEASDRLFQMELARRYAYGRLAEIFGKRALPYDLNMRAFDLAGIAQRQWLHADAATRATLLAFTGGVNAAIDRQPLPVEFRLLLYRPQRWTPQDSLAVSLVAALELGDSWRDVVARDRAWRDLGSRCYDAAYPLSDARYDTTAAGARVRSAVAAAPPCDRTFVAAVPHGPRIGSNAWAAPAARAVDRRAILANDPHADLTIPGIWYVVELRAPGMHVAGAALPGMPGVLLGHNGRLAWGATNAEASTLIVYRGRPRGARAVRERFGVRFGAPQTATFYRAGSDFSVDGGDGVPRFVRWPVALTRRSTVASMLDLDRASSIGAALRALARYRGAPENFVLADASGRVAYHLAGLIPDDPAWGRYVHPARDARAPLRLVPFAQLPQLAPSARGVVVSANNRPYAHGYRYRLSAAFEPPYRAYRIASLLRSAKRFDAAAFARMQVDTYSPLDAEIAAAVLRLDARGENPDARRLLARWDGRFDPSSPAATLAHGLRDQLFNGASTPAIALAQLRSQAFAVDEIYRVREALTGPLAVSPWGTAGAVTVDHPLSSAWYGLMSGRSLPGDGDEDTVRLQTTGFAQGFRAVWAVGDWNAGGISIPSGESGEPGSPHYDDRAAAWIAGTLEPLPFTPKAVRRATVSTLTLSP